MVNNSTTGSQLTTTEYYYEGIGSEIAHAIHFAFMSYVEPIFVTSGIIANVAILSVFLRQQAAKFCGKSTRLYYVVIASSDLINLVDMRLIVGFLDYGLEELTGGVFHPGVIQRWNDISCKIVWYVYFLSEQLSGFVLSMFSLERVFAVYLPMQVRKLWAYKRVVRGIALLIIAIVVGNVNSLVTLRKLPTPGKLSYEICLPDPNNPAQVAVYWLSYGFFNYGLPTILVIVFNTCILVRMMKESQMRTALMTVEKIAADMQKQRVATASLVLLALVHAIVFLPGAGVMTFEAFMFIGLAPVTQAQYATWYDIAYICFHITTIAKTLNFLVYYFRVPYFSRTLHHYFRCCQKKDLDKYDINESSIKETFAH